MIGGAFHQSILSTYYITRFFSKCGQSNDSSAPVFLTRTLDMLGVSHTRYYEIPRYYGILVSRHYEILTKWWFFQIFSKKWWLLKILAKIDDSSKSWQKLWIFQNFGYNLKNHHFFENIKKSSFFLPKLRKIFILCQNLKNRHFFRKFLKKTSLFPKNLKKISLLSVSYSVL